MAVDALSSASARNAVGEIINTLICGAKRSCDTTAPAGTGGGETKGKANTTTTSKHLDLRLLIKTPCLIYTDRFSS